MGIDKIAMKYCLPSLLLILLTGEPGQAEETSMLPKKNRTIEENEFHLPRESFRMVERGKEVRHTRLDRPCCEFKLDLTTLYRITDNAAATPRLRSD